MQAATSDPNGQGSYQMSLYNATVASRPLVLNQRVWGDEMGDVRIVLDDQDPRVHQRIHSTGDDAVDPESGQPPGFRAKSGPETSMCRWHPA